MRPDDTPLRTDLRFYQELNDFLPTEKRQVEFTHHLRQPASVKDVIEALDITPVTRLRPRPLRITRFVLDTHLGRLAAYLRMAGFDSLYRNDYDNPTLADISVTEQRILLTRDRYLLMRKIITHGYFVRHTQPRRQLREVLQRFDLLRQLQPFSRCMRCNDLLEKVDKSTVVEKIPAGTREWLNDYWQCQQCARVYWKGTHYQRMRALIDNIKYPPNSACPPAGRYRSS